VKHAAEMEKIGILLAPGAASAEALDRFLAIQGWRVPTPAGDMAAGKQHNAATTPALFCRDNLKTAQDRYEEAVKVETAALQQKLGEERTHFKEKRDAANVDYRNSLTALAGYESDARYWFSVGGAAALLLALVLGLIFFVMGMWRVVRSLPAARHSFA